MYSLIVSIPCHSIIGEPVWKAQHKHTWQESRDIRNMGTEAVIEYSNRVRD